MKSKVIDQFVNAVIVAVTLAILSFPVFPAGLQFLFSLVCGWGMFLWRVLPEVTWQAGGIVVAVASLTAFACGLHALCRRLFHEVGRSGQADKARWRLGWTAAFVMAVLAAFCAGGAMVGAVRHTVWLATDDTPMISWNSGQARQRWQSQNQLKQIGQAVYQYHDAHDSLPAGTTFDEFGRPLHGWQTHLLPYIGQSALHSLIDFSVPWDAAYHANPMSTQVPLYRNPGVQIKQNFDGKRRALSHYAGNKWVVGGRSPLNFRNIPDGLSNTLLAGEAAAEFKPWGHPLNFRDPMRGINTTPSGFGGPWNVVPGAAFLFADGTVRMIDEDIALDVLRALSTPAGGEAVGED